jgi:DNA-binding MarR family transcriptional regulator
MELTDGDYAALLQFRTALRRFNRWSESQAKSVGLTHAQHQLLLAIRGHDVDEPNVTDVAAALLLRHHSAVELVNRVEALGLIRRVPDPGDARIVRLHLTPEGERKLSLLTEAHLEELRRLAPTLKPLTRGLDGR